MKELFRTKLGKYAIKAMLWGLVGFAIAAAGNGLLTLLMGYNLYGLFYCLIFASYFVFLGSAATLLVMIITKYSKRCFCRKAHSMVSRKK